MCEQGWATSDPAASASAAVASPRGQVLWSQSQNHASCLLPWASWETAMGPGKAPDAATGSFRHFSSSQHDRESWRFNQQEKVRQGSLLLRAKNAIGLRQLGLWISQPRRRLLRGPVSRTGLRFLCPSIVGCSCCPRTPALDNLEHKHLISHLSQLSPHL